MCVYYIEAIINLVLLSLFWKVQRDEGDDDDGGDEGKPVAAILVANTKKLSSVGIGQ